MALKAANTVSGFFMSEAFVTGGAGVIGGMRIIWGT